jgi:cell division transport system ATP-binding protein
LTDKPTQPHIVFDDVEVKFSEYVYGLRGVSLSIQRGEFVFFVGQTGTGKSTLLKLLTKEVKPTSGSIHLWGVDMAEITDPEIPLLRRSMGIVPQDYALLPRKRVMENVGYAMRAVGATKKEVRKRVPDILEMVNIGHRADAFPDQLSGGERQRVAIARALINRPSLLIADEPTGNLDPEHSWGIMELLLELNRRGTTVLVASHDMMIVERMGKRIVRMLGGRVASDETYEPAPALIPVEEPETIEIPVEHTSIVETEEEELAEGLVEVEEFEAFEEHAQVPAEDVETKPTELADDLFEASDLTETAESRPEELEPEEVRHQDH